METEPEKQIQHQYHPLHPLTLTGWNPYDWGPHPCSACGKLCDGGFFYQCFKCEFNLDLTCASMVPTIAYKGHDHLLTLFDKVYKDDSYMAPCNSCDNPCDSSVFRCVDCNFNLHFHCFLPSLLPSTLKHDCHIDPLILTDSVAEEECHMDELYCDACEQLRNPKYPVYYCAECQFVAEIGCVISDVHPDPVVASVTAEQDRNTKAKKAEDDQNLRIRGTEVTAEPILAKLDEKIAKFQAEVDAQRAKLEELMAKLEALKGERAQYVASTMATQSSES